MFILIIQETGNANMYRFFAVTSPILYSQHRHNTTPGFAAILACWAVSLATIPCGVGISRRSQAVGSDRDPFPRWQKRGSNQSRFRIDSMCIEHSHKHQKMTHAWIELPISS